jgi:hypothetical protein
MLYSFEPVAWASFLAMGCTQRVVSLFDRVLTSVAGRPGWFAGGRAYQNVGQVVVGDVGQLLAVDFRDHELGRRGG